MKSKEQKQTSIELFPYVDVVKYFVTAAGARILIHGLVQLWALNSCLNRMFSLVLVSYDFHETEQDQMKSIESSPISYPIAN